MRSGAPSAEAARGTSCDAAGRLPDQSRPASTIALASRAGSVKHNSWLPGTWTRRNRCVSEHTVHRSRIDIAASSESCFYLNFKLAGHCRILQGKSDVSLSRGQVGICDSDREVTLLHDRGPTLEVVSFWVPSRALRNRLPPSFNFKSPEGRGEHRDARPDLISSLFRATLRSTTS
jgi:hypothetical protein